MRVENTNRKPGDVILDRYIPNANKAQREEARGNLYAFLEVLIRIADREERDAQLEKIRANSGSGVKSPDGTSPSP